MDVQTAEVLNAPGMDDDHAVFQTRDKLPHTRSEGRIPASARARRATGETVNRPKPGHSQAGASAPSTPRPIPKSNNISSQAGLKPSSMSSSYTFDASTDNPFLPSTPPAFTPSMERTGFKVTNPLEKSALASSTNDMPDLPSMLPAKATKTPTTGKQRAPFSVENRSISPPISKRSNAASPNTPMPFLTSTSTPASVTLTTTPTPAPFKPAFTRSRDASISSIPGMPGLPGPRHEDMILPAVAKRIKEQGLHEHDVIAYSDDYDAPLYKIPGSSASLNHPFASYDRMKAASSASLVQQPTSPIGSQPGNFYDDLDDTPLPPTPAIPMAFDPPSSNRRANRDADTHQVAPTSPKSETRSRREQQKQQQQQTSPPSTSDGRSEPTTTSDFNPSVPTSPTGPSGAARSERPRRPRRNTDHQTRQDQIAPNANGDYNRPSRTRRPTMPNSQDHESPIIRQQYSEVGHASPRQLQNQQQQQQQEQQQPQAFNNDARDRYYQSNEIKVQGQGQTQGSPWSINNTGYGNDSLHDGSPQMGNGTPQMGNSNSHAGQRYDVHNQAHGQDQGQYGQHNNDYSRARRQQEGYDSRWRNQQQPDAYNGRSRQAGYTSQQIGFHPQNGNYDQQPQNGGGYSARQERYNGHQGVLHGQQAEYNTQQQSNNYGRGSSLPKQEQIEVQRSQGRPEMSQVEMSQMSAKAGPDAGEVDQEDIRIDGKDLDQDKMKKKGSICCVIM